MKTVKRALALVLALTLLLAMSATVFADDAPPPYHYHLEYAERSYL